MAAQDDAAWLAEAESIFTAGTDVPEGEAFFSMGLDTHKIPMSMHAGNRAKLVERLQAAGHTAGVVLVQGGKSQNRYCSDTEVIFRQESYFSYLFGVAEPDWYGAIDVASGRTTLFCARLPEEWAVWMGRITSPAEFQRIYAVDDVKYADELDAWLKVHLAGDGGGGDGGGGDGGGGDGGSGDGGGAAVDAGSLNPLYLLHGLNSDSGSYTTTTADFEGLKWYTNVNRDVLHDEVAECRVVKSAAELEVMRYSSWLTSMAHVDVMRQIRPGMAEYQLEAIFKHYIYRNGGARHEAYTCICACGPNAAVLHYGHAGAPNNRILGASDIALLDMGAEYHCYTSDITCSYPVSGTFTAEQRLVYETVLECQKQIMEAMRPGVSWPDMHRLMWRVTLERLVSFGVLQGSVEDMLEAELGAVFIPCGLGHLIGCDTHDVGGYLPGHPPRIGEPGIKALRTARVLEEGMVLTVEPGLYFIDHTIEKALADDRQSKFFVPERLAEFRAFGGVRLEDVVAVTRDGIVNYTLTPRTVAEVESVMAGGPWPPARDDAKWLRRAWLKPLSGE